MNMRDFVFGGSDNRVRKYQVEYLLDKFPGYSKVIRMLGRESTWAIPVNHFANTAATEKGFLYVLETQVFAALPSDSDPDVDDKLFRTIGDPYDEVEKFGGMLNISSGEKVSTPKYIEVNGIRYYPESEVYTREDAQKVIDAARTRIYDEGFAAGRIKGLEEADRKLNVSLSNGSLKEMVDKLSGLPLETIEFIEKKLEQAGTHF